MAEATTAQAYNALVRSRVAAQASYRASFAIELGSQVLLVLVEFVEVYVVFHQVDALGGFDFAEVAAQVAWTVGLLLLGRLVLSRATHKLVVQGG